MQTVHGTYEAAKSELLGNGFVRYISCIDGAERFSKPGTVDEFYGAYRRDAIARIQHHWVSPKWGDEGNYFSIEFL